MTEEEQIRVINVGRDAEALKSNETLALAFQATLDDLFAQFIATNADEGALRDAIWAQANALREFNSTLDAFITEGQMERHNRDQDLRKYK